MADETERLVVEASRGDAGALADLLARYLPELRAFLRLRTGTRILAREQVDDLSQSVCREVLEDIDAFEYRGSDSFKRWLFLTAWRKIKDRAKYHGREARDARRERPLPEGSQWLTGFADLVSPSRAAVRREDAERLEAAFDQLPDDYRAVVTMARCLGMSHAEIAAELGKSEGATRVLLHRALARLGRLLDE